MVHFHDERDSVDCLDCFDVDGDRDSWPPYDRLQPVAALRPLVCRPQPLQDFHPHTHPPPSRAVVMIISFQGEGNGGSIDIGTYIIDQLVMACECENTFMRTQFSQYILCIVICICDCGASQPKRKNVSQNINENYGTSFCRKNREESNLIWC